MTSRTRITAFALLFGATSAATAQGLGRWDIEIDNPLLFPGSPSTGVTLWLEPPAGDYAVGGANFSIHADQGSWSNPTALLSHPGQNPGMVVGSSVTGASIGQLAAFGFVPAPGRIAVWEATFTADFPFTVIELWTETTRFEVYGDPPVSTMPRELTEGRAQIFIPAPGALGFLGVGAGLMAIRRRRT